MKLLISSNVIIAIFLGIAYSLNYISWWYIPFILFPFFGISLTISLIINSNKEKEKLLEILKEQEKNNTSENPEF